MVCRFEVGDGQPCSEAESQDDQAAAASIVAAVVDLTCGFGGRKAGRCGHCLRVLVEPVLSDGRVRGSSRCDAQVLYVPLL